VSVPSSWASSFLLAQDDGTDTEFRNVGLYTSDDGEFPKRILTTFRTRRKLENYHTGREIWRIFERNEAIVICIIFISYITHKDVCFINKDQTMDVFILCSRKFVKRLVRSLHLEINQ